MLKTIEQLESDNYYLDLSVNGLAIERDQLRRDLKKIAVWREAMSVRHGHLRAIIGLAAIVVVAGALSAAAGLIGSGELPASRLLGGLLVGGINAALIGGLLLAWSLWWDAASPATQDLMLRGTSSVQPPSPAPLPAPLATDTVDYTIRPSPEADVDLTELAEYFETGKEEVIQMSVGLMMLSIRAVKSGRAVGTILDSQRKTLHEVFLRGDPDA